MALVSQGWTGAADITATLNRLFRTARLASDRVNWQFGSGEGWTNNSTASLQNAGWQFRSGTNVNANSYVNSTHMIDDATGVMFSG